MDCGWITTITICYINKSVELLSQCATCECLEASDMHNFRRLTFGMYPKTKFKKNNLMDAMKMCIIMFYFLILDGTYWKVSFLCGLGSMQFTMFFKTFLWNIWKSKIMMLCIGISNLYCSFSHNRQRMWCLCLRGFNLLICGDSPNHNKNLHPIWKPKGAEAQEGELSSNNLWLSITRVH